MAGTMDSPVYASWHPAFRPNTLEDIVPSAPISIPSKPTSEASQMLPSHPDIISDSSIGDAIPQSQDQSPIDVPELLPDTTEDDAAIAWDQADNTDIFDIGEQPLPNGSLKHVDEVAHIETGEPQLDWADEETESFNIGDDFAPLPVTQDIEQTIANPAESAINWGASEGEAFDIGDNSIPQPVQIDSSIPAQHGDATIDWGASIEEQDAFNSDADPTEDAMTNEAEQNPVGDINGTPKDPAVVVDALWDDAFGEEEFLPDTAEDGGDVEFPDFGDDDEGFLDDQHDDMPEQTTGFTSTTASRYAPAQVTPQVEPQAPQNQYLPAKPQFTDFSQVNQQQQHRSVSSVPPMGYQSVPPVRPDLAPASAASFSDKAKVGYASPYDLPDDFAKPKKRNSQVMTQNWGGPNAPPPRSTSLPTGPHGAVQPLAGPYGTKLITPPSSSHSVTAPAGTIAFQPSAPTSAAAARPSSQSGFFEDLPLAPRQRSSGRYTPQPQTPNLPSTYHAQAAVPPVAQAPLRPVSGHSNIPQLQPPAKLQPYSDEANGNLQQSIIPAALANRYSSPAGLPASRQVSGPPAANLSRYSPAPNSKPLPAINPNRYVAEPPQARPPFAPRTSSPLTYQSLSQESHESPQSQSQPPPVPPKHDHHPFTRMASLTQPSLEPVAENETSIVPPNAASALMSSRGATPPPPRSGRSSLSSSPRKRGNYLPTASLNDPAIVPPKRSQTSSPGSAIPQARGSAAFINRPASAQDMNAPTNPYANLGFTNAAPQYQRKEVMPPQDETVNDPLQRWRGSPLFVWGGSGTTVSAFPTYAPRYVSGTSGPLMVASGGEFKIRNASALISAPSHLSSFPGPLKKGKKKELYAWLKSSVEQLEVNVKDLILNSGLHGIALIRMQERVLLWKLLQILVDNDGVLEGTPAVDSAVKSLLQVGAIEPAMSLADGADILADALSPKELATLRSHLHKGEREEAVWHAVDQRLWGPALLIASTLSKDKWGQVVQEFVRKEVRDKSLASLFQVFAGNWDESVDELVSVSARAGFQMVSTTSTTANQDALAGLEKWQETVSLILSNRSPGDAQSLVAIGKLLATYGRFEAAHVCFIFSQTTAFFGGPDDPRTAFSLIGGDPNLLGADFGGDLEAILLSEVYEYCLSILPTPVSPIPHLQAYKLYHAEVLAENGHRSDAQQYCNSINTTMHSKTKSSPYYNVVFMQSVDNLTKRLSEAPVDPSTSWKPSMDKVSSTLWGKLSNFVQGEENETTPPAAGVASDGGQFQRLASDTPPMSTSASTADLYGAYQSGAAITSPVNTRYAPNNQYAPKRTGERGRYDSVPGANYQPRTSLESSRSSYEGRRSLDVHGSLSPKRVSSYSALVPSVVPQQANGQPNGLSVPSQLGPQYRPHSASPYQSSPTSSQQNDSAERPVTQPAESSPYAPSYGYSPYATQQTEPETEPQSQPSYAPSSYFEDSGAPTQSFEAGDQPDSSYNAPTSLYEPVGYQPYEPEPQEEPSESLEEKSDEKKPKKKSFFDDDDDDDLIARAAALKSAPKGNKDREVDDAFRKAAEADAARPKAGERPKSGWFGGWFGGAKKDDNLDAAKKPTKANLGESNQFVFDPELNKWVNKAAGAKETAVTPSATPPPPKLTPRPSTSGLSANGTPPSISSPNIPPAPPSSAIGFSGPPMSRSTSMPQPLSKPPGSGPPTPGSLKPPSRPATSMSNASDIDDLLGPAMPRTRGGAKGKKKGRYVDVMAMGN